MGNRKNKLFQIHPESLTVVFSNIEAAAWAHGDVFLGTPGSVGTRTNQDGVEFYSRTYYDAAKKKREEYIAGPVGSPEADEAAENVRAKIADVNEQLAMIRLLEREGFVVESDRRSYATIAALHNHGVFEAGGILIGSHAYGALLNKMGVRAPAYKTEDVDVARDSVLALKRRTRPLLEVLRETGVDFVEVPAFKRGDPPTSVKERGRSAFRVDLLVPSPNETFPTIEVPELGAHATGLPYLGFLLKESQPAIIMARQGFVPVRIPLAERYAVHKLVVSQLRSAQSTKAQKDIQQATLLCAVLGELYPGALRDAATTMSKRMRKHFKRALTGAAADLEHKAPQAWDELTEGTQQEI